MNMPTAVPPSMLTRRIPAIASPLTNFIAPSIAQYYWLSICLPSMPSGEKRAPTSATRSEPFVATIGWTIVIITNTISPTPRLPPTAKLPNV